ncbi:MAG: peptidylprolyl isomerase [Minisyncoccia bacterium]
MNLKTKSVTNWILFIFTAFSAFGVVYKAIAVTNEELAKITTDIVEINRIAGTNMATAVRATSQTKNTKPVTQNTNTMDEKQITKATFKTNYGDIEVTFRKETPVTVANFTKLAKEGFYDGTRFHRVIKNFMIQGGDPKSKDLNLKNEWGTGGPGYVFKDEVFQNDQMNQGVLAMANAGPGTNGSQFFIVTAPQGTDWLVGKHTIFGKVTRGLDVALAIEGVATSAGDKPVKDVIVEKIILQ